MASYGGITFYVLAEQGSGQASNQIVFKDWDYGDSDAVARTKIPYANVSYTQQTGRVNPVLTLKCELYSDADMTTLRALRGDNTPRTLVDPFDLGWDYSNVLLQKIRDIERVTYAEEWHATLEFEQIA